MRKDNIKKIAVDDAERLCITPEKENFEFVYRSALKVHWDEKNLFLYSPKPREWTYFDWYKQILSASIDCGCELYITQDTIWINIPENLKKDILKFRIH